MVKNPPRTKGELKKLINYINNDEKTREILSGGINCDHANAFRDFEAVKEQFRKTDGIQARHMIQSFSVDDKLTPAQAKEIAEKFLAHPLFEGFQVIYAVHLDREHLHTHFVLNTVNSVTGKMWHQNNKDLRLLKEFSNQICKEYGLSEIEFNNRGGKSTGEYKAEQRNISWKYELYLAVVNAKLRSTSIKNFKELLEEIGYKVKWEHDKKYITFTTPDNKKCRNRNLYPASEFTKNAIADELNKNAQIYSAEELNSIRGDFISRVKSCTGKYPLSSLNLDDRIIEYEQWYEQNKDKIINDEKYELYKKIGYALKYSVSYDKFKEKLKEYGAEVFIDKSDTVFVYNDNQYRADELYQGEKYTLLNMKMKFYENMFSKNISKSVFCSASMEELKKNLEKYGYVMRTENGRYVYYDDKNTAHTHLNESALSDPKRVADMLKERKYARELFTLKLTSDSFMGFLESISEEGWSFEIKDEKIKYHSLGGTEVSNEQFNVKELEEYFQKKADRCELQNTIKITKWMSYSMQDFREKMNRLGYRVDVNTAEGTMKITTPKKNEFKNSELFPAEWYSLKALEDQFRKNQEKRMQNIWSLFLSIFDMLMRTESCPVTAMDFGDEPTGDALREFMYKFEKGTASQYNRNLDNDWSM